MKFTPTINGGRLLAGDTPFGLFSIQVDESVVDAKIINRHDRIVGAATVIIRDPKVRPKPERQETSHEASKMADTDTPKHRLAPPGTWLASLIFVVTLGRIRPCTACKSRARAMDQAGWSGLIHLWARWAWRRLFPPPEMPPPPEVPPDIPQDMPQDIPPEGPPHPDIPTPPNMPQPTEVSPQPGVPLHPDGDRTRTGPTEFEGGDHGR